MPGEMWCLVCCVLCVVRRLCKGVVVLGSLVCRGGGVVWCGVSLFVRGALFWDRVRFTDQREMYIRETRVLLLVLLVHLRAVQ